MTPLAYQHQPLVLKPWQIEAITAQCITHRYPKD